MKLIWRLAAKDFRLLFRDKIGLFWAFGFPLLIALFFGAMFSGASNSRAISIAFVDEDQSELAHEFKQILIDSPSVKIEPMSRDEAITKVRQGKLAAYLILSSGFDDNAGFFGTGNAPAVELGIDPSRRAEEGLLQGILMQAGGKLLQKRFFDKKKMSQLIQKAKDELKKSDRLTDAQKKTLTDLMGNFDEWINDPDVTQNTQNFDFQPIRIESKSITRETSGPKNSFEITFPQGVMWGILGTITSFAVGLMTERTNGTMLRLRLAPLTFMQLLAGKALACFLTCLLISASVLLLGHLAFSVVFSDYLLLVASICSCGICFTGIMMLLSTVGKTERSVNGIGWGILMPLTMIGGASVPLAFMPSWMVAISDFSPVKWSILSLEGAIWRGFSWGEMLLPCAIQIGVGSVCFLIGVWKLSKQEMG